MKRLIVILCFCAILLTMGCTRIETNRLVITSAREVPENKITPEIEEVISQYIVEEVVYTRHPHLNGKVFEAHEIFGSEIKDDSLYIYMWVHYLDYYVASNRLKRSSGGTLPMAFVLKNDEEGKAYVVEHKKRGDIREMFPRKYHDIASTRPHNVIDLDKIVQSKARAYFKTIDQSKLAKLEKPEIMNYYSDTELMGSINDLRSYYNPFDPFIEYLYFGYLYAQMDLLSESIEEFTFLNSSDPALELVYDTPFDVDEYLIIERNNNNDFNDNFKVSFVIIPINDDSVVWLLDDNYHGYKVKSHFDLYKDYIEQFIEEIMNAQ